MTCWHFDLEPLNDVTSQLMINNMQRLALMNKPTHIFTQLIETILMRGV